MNFLYFNISDTLNVDDNSFYYMEENYEITDKYSGFFFNLSNITKTEIISFLLYYEVDEYYLSKNNLIEKFILFFSYFMHEGLIINLMKIIHMNELCFVFDNNFFNKYYIIKIMCLFNDRLLLEIYRLFVTFKKQYKCHKNFAEFKLFIISNISLFDNNEVLYKYMYFLDHKLYTTNDYYHFVLFEDDKALKDRFFYDCLSFSEFMDFLLEELMTNLYNIYYYNLFLSTTKNNKINDLKYLFLKKKEFKIKGRYNIYINNLMFNFIQYHEIFSFFRYYLYFFHKFSYFIKTNYNLFISFFNFFKIQFNKLYNYYEENLFFNNLYLKTLMLNLYKDIRKKIYIYLVNKNNILLKNFYLNFNIILYKFYNLLKLNFLYNQTLLDDKLLTIYYNLNFSTLIKNKFNILNIDLISGLNVNLNLPLNNIKELNLYKNYYFSFVFKQNQYLSKYKNKLYFSYNFMYKFFFSRRSLNIYIYNINESFSTNITLIPNLKYNIIIKFFFGITYPLYKVITYIYDVSNILIFSPLMYRVETNIDEFFYLVSEDVLVEDFDLYSQDSIIQDREDGMETELGDTHNDSEDDFDFFDDIDELESEDFFFFEYIEELISINTYIDSSLNLKYKSNMSYLTIKRINELNADLDYDMDYSKNAPHIDKYFVRNQEYELSHLIDNDSWYLWLTTYIYYDLQSYHPNFYESTPIITGSDFYVKFAKKNIINLDMSPEYDYDGKIITVKSTELDSLYVDYDSNKYNLSDNHIFSEYSSFNLKLNKLYYLDLGDSTDLLGEDEVLIEETNIRDLVLFHEKWIWWQLLLKNYSYNKLNKLNLSKFKAKNKDELYFINTYILSGFYFLIIKVLHGSAHFETQDRITALDKIINLIFTDKVLKLETINTFKNKSQSYYNDWLYKYHGLFFNLDYGFIFDLYKIYENKFYSDLTFLQKPSNKYVHPQIYSYFKRLNKIFNYSVNNIIRSFIGSYYINKNQNKFLFFWEQFYLIIIESLYSFSDYDFLNEVQEDEIGYVQDRYSFNEIIHTLLDSIVEDVFDYFENPNILFTSHLTPYLNQVMNPYYLLNKGLDIDFSLSENILFDLYQTYLDYFITIGNNDFDDSSLYDPLRLEDPDDNHKSHRYEELTYLDESPNFSGSYGVDYNLDVVSFNSVQFSNLYIAEDYHSYLERYYSINSLNFFLYGVYNNFLTKYSSFFNDNSFDLIRNKLNVVVLDKYNSKLNKNLDNYFLSLNYYYFINITFMYMKKVLNNFNLFFFLNVYMFFFIFFKNLNLPLNYNYLYIYFFPHLFFYIIYKFLYKVKNLKLNYQNLYKYISDLNFLEFFKLIKYIFLELYKYIIIFVKSLLNYGYKNLYIIKYGKLVNFFLKKKIYLYIYKYFFNIDFISNKILIKNIDYSYVDKISFRSFMSTYNLYKKDDLYTYNKFSNKYIFDYLKNYEKPNVLYKKENKISNLNYNFQDFNTNIKIKDNLLDISKIDFEIFEFFDSSKDMGYHDYEDNFTDDQSEINDNWTIDYTLGDVSEDYEIDDLNIASPEQLFLHEEEFHYLFDLEYSYVAMHNHNSLFIDFDRYQNKRPWGYRFLHFMNRVYYVNLNYFRKLLLLLLNAYKSKVKITSKFYSADERASLFRYGFPPKINKTQKDYDLEDLDTFMGPYDSRFFKIKDYIQKKKFKKQLNVNSVYNNKLIIKKMYNYELIDVLDFFIDYNNVEITEYDVPIEFYISLNNVSYDFNLFEYNLNINLIKLIKFLNFTLLYYNIYKYIDNKYSKIIFILNFFFDILNFFLLYIKKYNKKIKYSNKYNFYKYIYDQISIFYINELKKYNKILFLKEKEIENENLLHYFIFIKNNFSFIPFYSFNYKLLLKKIYILKYVYGSQLTIYSYMLLIKGLDWVLSLIDKNKKKIITFFLFLKKILIKFEFFIFLNAYRLAQIYIKFGLHNNYIFFETYHLNLLLMFQKNTFLKKFKYLEYIFFFLEYFFYVFLCVLSVAFVLKYIMTLYFGRGMLFRPQRYSEFDESDRGTNFTFGRYMEARRVHYLTYSYWYDVWGFY